MLIEKGARGTDGRKYPRGNAEPDKGRCNFGGNVGKTTAVGNYSTGASPYGALDMAGNVWEWTSSRFSDYPYVGTDGREDSEGGARRVLRGGSWYGPPYIVRAANRFRDYPDHRLFYLGVRLVLAVAPDKLLASEF